MKFVKWTAIVLGVLLLVCGIAGMVMPNKWEVETSVVIDATPERIYPHIANPRKFVTYTEAYGRAQPEYDGTEFEYEFSEDPAEGAGAWYVSQHKTSRVRIEYTRSDQMQGIWYDGMINADEVNDHGSITFEPVEDGSKTKVTWVDEGTTPIPVFGSLLVVAFDLEGVLEKFFHGTLLEMKKAVEAEE